MKRKTVLGKAPSKIRTHIRVRAVIIRKGKILLCKNNELGHLYLPGGHVDEGELAREALPREIGEEIVEPGKIEVGRPVAVIERHFFDRRRESRTYEICILFAVLARSISNTPQSRESYISFAWYDVTALGRLNIPNPVLPDAISFWIAQKRFQYYSSRE